MLFHHVMVVVLDALMIIICGAADRKATVASNSGFQQMVVSYTCITQLVRLGFGLGIADCNFGQRHDSGYLLTAGGILLGHFQSTPDYTPSSGRMLANTHERQQPVIH